MPGPTRSRSALACAFLILVLGSTVSADESVNAAVVPAQAEESAEGAPPSTWLSMDVPAALAAQDRIVTAGRADELKALLRDLKKAHPDSALAKFLYARLSGGSLGRLAMRKALEKRLGLPVDRAPEIGAGWSALARAEMDAANWDDALSAARHAATLTQAAGAHALVGWLAQHEDDDDLALTSYTTALRIDATLLQARHAMAPLLLERGELAHALRLCKGTLLLTPRSAVAHLHWGMSLSSAGNVEDAREAYQVAIQLAAGDPDRVSSIATGLRRIEHAELAEDALRSALRAAPEHYGLLSNLAVLHIDRQEYADAIPLLAQARKARPKEPTTYFLLGVAQERSGKAKKAVQSLLRAVRLAPDNLDYLLALGSAYRSDDQHGRALQIFRKAAKKFPMDAKAAAAHARALFDRKKNKDAAKAYERVIELDPTATEARFLLAILYGGHLGQLERAYQRLQEYERLGGAEPGALEWLEQLRERFEK